MQNIIKKPERNTSLPVNAEVRGLVEEVMALGNHGTLTNTIYVALKSHRRLLRGELIERSSVQLPVAEAISIAASNQHSSSTS